MSGTMKLVGDIGGTRSRLALSDGKALHQVKAYSNADFTDFSAVLAAYLAEEDVRSQSLRACCLAVAGPITDDRRSARLTNHPWQIELAVLQALLALAADRLRLVNDFAAAAMGVTVRTASPPLPLQTGAELADGVRLVLGAGTGLGVALLVRHDQHWQVLPGEGGHIGFAPQDEQQDGLCRWLRQRHGRVIVEHLASGIGLVNIDTFLAEQTSPASTPRSAAAIAAAARQAEPRARAAFDLFASIYGAVAGDYALAGMARGGVFLAGGVAAANQDLMQRPAFLQAFNAKGAHSDLAQRMPVCIVTEPWLGLHGAAALAEQARA